VAAKKARKVRSNSPDWGEIERLYVQGEMGPAPEGGAPERTFPSYSVLAARFGVALRTVAHRGALDEWPRKREEFRQSLQVQLHRNVIATASSALADATRKGIAVREKLWGAIDAAIERGRAEGEFTLEPKDIDQLAAAAKKLTETQRIELGLPETPGGAKGGSGAGEGARRAVDEAIMSRALDAVFAGNETPPETRSRAPGSGEE
jgi:hypothetical protein